MSVVAIHECIPYKALWFISKNIHRFSIRCSAIRVILRMECETKFALLLNYAPALND